jgi:hypothetical protein
MSRLRSKVAAAQDLGARVRHKIHPHWNAILYVIILTLIPISVLTLPLPLPYPFQLTTPPSSQTFVHSFGTYRATWREACGVGQTEGVNNTVTVGEIAVQISNSHGSLTADVPMTATVTLFLNETNFCLTYGPWFLKPSLVYVRLNGAFLSPPQTDNYGLPTQSFMELRRVSVLNGIEKWTNTSVVQYVDQRVWGYTEYLYENSTGVDAVAYPYSSYYSTSYVYFYTDNGDPYGVVIEPFSVAVSYVTNSLIASFTIFLIVLACLDSRTVGYRRHKKIDYLHDATSGKRTFCSSCGSGVGIGDRFCANCGAMIK